MIQFWNFMSDECAERRQKKKPQIKWNLKFEFQISLANS